MTDLFRRIPPARFAGFPCLRFILTAWALFVDRAPAASPQPTPLPGWRLELVAEAPRIRHPTVIACAPDGRIFVAEDPMDISLPKADAAEGRILCLHPDGRTTVFADKLFAVFGLQYLEGKVYALHNPRFSVFDDDQGVGRNRRELIEQTLPDPSALNWNDHIPANFRLGMDGFFYVACGDKGLHGARGTDGSRADLFSGGTFRIRPDGTQLEVMTHGVRNILDVALNAEDEQFTYDNTDEHDWMGRFTHMVEAGFYGYPHDFIPRRPYTLWMIEDYGAGAACGAFAYNEDSLPPEFHGNVFLSDFGKRQIMRVRVERSGATYRALSKEDLFPDPPGDFRPVGITPSSDGRGFLIADWNHRDEKADVQVGRLFRLSWTGADLAAPKPAWYLPIASGLPSATSNSDLIRGLSHPSHQVRLTAQRQLAARRAVPEAQALLLDTTAPGLARSHALWTLDAIDQGRAARASIVQVANDRDALLRRQILRQLGTRRVVEASTAVRARLTDTDAAVRFQAATALGRIGAPDAVSDLVNTLADSDDVVRYATFTALHRIGTNSPSAWRSIVQGLAHDSPRIREGARFALRETYDERLLAELIDFARDSRMPPPSRQTAWELLAALHRRKPDWQGQWWAYHPALQAPPEKSVIWTGTDTVLATLRDGLRDPNPDIRRTCIRGLATARDAMAAAPLRTVFPSETDPTSRATILEALGALKDTNSFPLIAAELRQPSHPEATRAAITAAESFGNDSAASALSDFLRSRAPEAQTLARAIAALGHLKFSSTATAIEGFARHADAAVRSEVFRALGRLQGEVAIPLLSVHLQDPDLNVRRSIVRSLDDLKSTNAVPVLLGAHSDPALRADTLRALTRTPDPRSLDVLLDALGSRNPTERNAAHLAISDLRPKVLAAIEARADQLPSQALVEIRQIYAGHASAEKGPLFARTIRQFSPEEYLEAALQRPGDTTRGQNIFAAQGGVQCTACHRVAGVGSDLGPDLSGIGTQFDRRALAESILYPSKAVREGYQQITIEMTDGEEYAGLIKAESGDTLTLRDSAGREHRLPRASVRSRRNSSLSLMPEGLQSALTLDEFADLIAYLSTLGKK